VRTVSARHEHDVSQRAEHREEALVAGAAEPTRPPGDRSGTVDAGDHVETDRRAALDDGQVGVDLEWVDGINRLGEQLAHQQASAASRVRKKSSAAAR
jgi:hypothetical protein